MMEGANGLGFWKPLIQVPPNVSGVLGAIMNWK